MKREMKLTDAMIFVAVIVVVLGVIVGAALKAGKSEYDAATAQPVATPAPATVAGEAPVVAE
jgi:cation transporter-like permease